MKAAFIPGTIFASYRVESLIGRGGMGVVYLAHDLSLDRPVALKLIAPEYAEDAQFRARFLREKQLAASLDHPNVIPIYEAGEDDDQLYIAMRYVKGSDLRTALDRDGKLTPERTIEVVAQIAGALDAAHERALVHRDVKPANVLLDEAGHPYLTDFGISKPPGAEPGDADEGGGTLDYLAPEQIRGEDVDGRTDGYALACLLYECLSGSPPFRRQTEAETLWAHMREEPRPLRGRPALDRVLRRALAKDRDARYPTCEDFAAEAAGALGVAAPRSVARRLAARRTRHVARLLVGGGLLVLVAAGAAFLALGGDDDPAPPPQANGIAALESDGARLASFTETRTPPSSLAVGEGSVWALGLDGASLTRVDPDTRKVLNRFKLGGSPTDIAVGAGAVWIRGRDRSVSRIDPRTGEATNVVRLPEIDFQGDVPFQNLGYPQVAVGAGAVWVINEDRRVWRIDPETGEPVARIDVDATTIAAGREGVWFIRGDETKAVTRIDPRSNRPAQTIKLGTQNLSAIAVGGGRVWASAEGDGLVWRIDPGRDPVTRTIDVGVGVTFLAFGGGAIWTANYSDGTVSRIDVETNDVEAAPVGAVQSIAADERTAWVSTAGATGADGLPQSCDRMMSGGSEPDVLVAADLPLLKLIGPGPHAAAAAIKQVFEQHGFRAGRHRIGYSLCDSSTAHTWLDRRACAANANAYGQAERLVAVIGTYFSDCAMVELPILNRAPGGAVAMISPSNTYQGLTRRGQRAPWGYRDEPDVFYPTGTRNYLRIPALDDTLGTAQAVLAKQLGLRSVYILDDGSVFWRGLQVEPFRYAARRLGVPIAGVARFDEKQPTARILDRIERSGAEGVLLTGDPFMGADMVKALRRRFGSRMKLMADFYYGDAPTVLKETDGAARGIYVATSDQPRSENHLTPAGRRFMNRYGPDVPGGFVLEAAQAAELVVQAIARSDGSRESVLRELKASRVKNGLVGSFQFDRNGDLTPVSVPIMRITAKDRVIDRVVRIPRRLVR